MTPKFSLVLALASTLTAFGCSQQVDEPVVVEPTEGSAQTQLCNGCQPAQLPNLYLSPSFMLYKDASGYWTLRFYVSNTGAVATTLGAVKAISETDAGYPVQSPGAVYTQWSNVVINPGETKSFNLGVPGNVYASDGSGIVYLATAPSLAPYRMHVWVDYNYNGSAKLESNESDNERIFDFK